MNIYWKNEQRTCEREKISTAVTGISQKMSTPEKYLHAIQKHEYKQHHLKGWETIAPRDKNKQGGRVSGLSLNRLLSMHALFS